MAMNPSEDEDVPVIHSYSRAQAIEDGVLVDLTEWASQTGFKVPVACTAAVRHSYIVPTEELRPVGQSERGRAHDLLWLLYVAVRKCPSRTDQLMFKVIFLMSPRNHETVKFKAISGPGDTREMVLTIMMPEED
jgi:hypothetical protein